MIISSLYSCLFRGLKQTLVQHNIQRYDLLTDTVSSHVDLMSLADLEVKKTRVPEREF